ncbi:hypothetical protein ACFT25_06115 [Streptomyces hydrogenans]|uniref:hypothetical protein n=1 Tax=Streptomyces hydrogenans TaxID=1873719 RepID=UPI00362F022D
MTQHTVSSENPVHVTGADSYRITYTFVITPDSPVYEETEDNLKPAHRRPGGHGIALLESEEHHLAYYGPIAQIEAFREGTALDLSQGAVYAKWPQGEQWDTLIPAGTWTQSGEGIITTFDHPLGGKVTVYEFLQAAEDGTQVPTVAFHCDRCHPIPGIDHETTRRNTGPQDRRWTARLARTHIHRHAALCRPVDPRYAEVAQTLLNQETGVDAPTVTWESRCATTGPCAQIRHLRACA